MCQEQVDGENAYVLSLAESTSWHGSPLDPRCVEPVSELTNVSHSKEGPLARPWEIQLIGLLRRWSVVLIIVASLFTALLHSLLHLVELLGLVGIESAFDLGVCILVDLPHLRPAVFLRQT